MTQSSVVRNKMTAKTVIPFLAITFGLSWGIAALLIFFTDQMVAIFGEITNRNPLFILMAWSPGIAGVLLVWRHYGLKGLGSFFRRMTLWRMPLVWWLFLIIGIPVLAYIAAALNGTIGDPFPFSPWYEVFPALLQSLFLLGTIEEFGWRGLLQPLLQRRLAPIWAGLIVGFVWASWHLPVFLFGGGVQYSAWPVVPYMGGVIALAVILTPMFNSSRGSLLIAFLYHFQVMNPIFPDGQPWDSLIFAIVAVVVVILNRRTMFKKGSGVTDVLYPEQTSEDTGMKEDQESDEMVKKPLSIAG